MKVTWGRRMSVLGASPSWGLAVQGWTLGLGWALGQSFQQVPPAELAPLGGQACGWATVTVPSWWHRPRDPFGPRPHGCARAAPLSELPE